MIKPGVRLIGLQPQIVLAYVICEPILKAHGQPAVITSLCDGRHSRQSRHYIGMAMDLRTRDLEANDKRKVADLIADALGDEYFVLLEDTHLHLQFNGGLS